MAESVQQADPAVAQAAVDTGVAPPAPSQAASTPAASQASQATPATPAAQTPADQITDILDILRQRDPELGRFTSGEAAVEHLLQARQRARELERYAPYLQEYTQYGGQFQAWRQEQAQKQQAQAAEAKKWFSAPEFKEEWLAGLVQGADGNVQVRPGYPPDLANKYLAWRQHQQQFLNKFSSDPVGSIRPGIEQVVQELVQKGIQQHLGQYSETQEAERVLQNNRAWLYDQQGQFTPWGQVYAQTVKALTDAGLHSTKLQDQLATMAAQNAWMMQQMQRQPAQGAQADPQKAAFLQAMQPAGATGGAAAVPAQAVPASPAPQGGSHVSRLQRLLAKNAATAGLTNGVVQVPG